MTNHSKLFPGFLIIIIPVFVILIALMLLTNSAKNSYTGSKTTIISNNNVNLDLSKFELKSSDTSIYIEGPKTTVSIRSYYKMK